jgi:FkbM family methyltransferase
MRVIETPNGVYEVDEEDCWIRNHMSGGQVFESHIINGYLRNIITQSKYIVDVGANIGCHTVSYGLFNKESEIWSFEPQKKTFDILARNVDRNNLSNRVKVFNCGLGHTEMECEMASVESADKDVHRGGCNKGGLGLGQGGEKTKILTLDSLDLPGLDYMKIDVEGAEGLVIMGARKTIQKYKPVVFFEHNSQTINPSHVNLDRIPTPFEELSKLGYRQYVYTDWENYLAFVPK